MLQQILSVEAIALGVGVLVSGAILVYRTVSKQGADLKLRRLIQIQDGTVVAWHFAEFVAKDTAWTWDDKLAAALKKAAEVISAQTGKPLSESETVAVATRLQALEGAKAAGVPIPPPVPR
jgi:hypothetical protein